MAVDVGKQLYQRTILPAVLEGTVDANRKSIGANPIPSLTFR